MDLLAIFASFALAKIHQFALAKAGHLNSKYSMSASGNTPPNVRSHKLTVSKEGKRKQKSRKNDGPLCKNGAKTSQKF